MASGAYSVLCWDWSLLIGDALGIVFKDERFMPWSTAVVVVGNVACNPLLFLPSVKARSTATSSINSVRRSQIHACNMFAPAGYTVRRTAWKLLALSAYTGTAVGSVHAPPSLCSMLGFKDCCASFLRTTLAVSAGQRAGMGACT